MNQKVARDQRRETKRTLGKQLEEFAHDQHRRLDDFGPRVEAVELRAERIVQRLQNEGQSRTYQDAWLKARGELFETMTFAQRLRWFITGHVPALEFAWEPTEGADVEEFWSDVGRPPA